MGRYRGGYRGGQEKERAWLSLRANIFYECWQELSSPCDEKDTVSVAEAQSILSIPQATKA
jgi:hypothetical protein